MSAVVMSGSGVFREGPILVDEREDGFVSSPQRYRRFGNEYCEGGRPGFVEILSRGYVLARCGQYSPSTQHGGSASVVSSKTIYLTVC